MNLLEREPSLESLNGWLAQTSAGTGCVVLVAGEAGIGKTALLQEFTSRQRLAKQVLWGGCEALFTPHPLAPFYDIARQAGGEFQRAIAMAETRDGVFNATMDHLSRGAMPMILVFEDVHWADEATLDLIKYLGRRLTRLGVMLIATYRDDEVGARHPLRAVLGDLPPAIVHRLHLSPLSASAVATLAKEAGHSAAGLHEITGGNPFFVTETLAVPADKVPATVRDAVIARLARLSQPARALVNLAALVPGKTERWLLDKAAPESGSDFGALLAECLAVGMVAMPDGSLAFRHELARRAVEEHLPVPQRQALHARILQILQREIGHEIPTTRLVHHADLAGDEAAVLRHGPLAAERAASLGAHREAAAHYATVLRHASSLPDERRAELYEQRSYECYLIDEIGAAISAREAALELRRAAGDPLKVGDNFRWLSRLAWFNGQKAAAEDYAKLAIATLEAQPPGRELAMAYSNCAQLYMLANAAELALQWGGKAIDLATTLGETDILSHAYNNVGTTRATRLDPGGRDDLERSLALALAGGFQEHAARAYTNLATTALRRRDFTYANQYLQAGIAYSEEHDLDSWVRYMTGSRATARLMQGDWAAAADDAQAVIRHPRVAPVSRIPALVVLGLVRARRGDPDAETPLAEAAELALPTGEIQRIGPVIAARAEAAWLKGDLAAMAREIRTGNDLARQQPDPWMDGELAFWLHRCEGGLEEGIELAEPYRLQRAGKWLAAAVAWEKLGCPYEQAMALAECTDEPDLRRSLEILERLGAVPLAGMVRRKLRAGGVRGIARGAQARHRQNPQGLTTRELAVLALVTQGLRNADIARRLFVSEKTVDHHVSAILGKLGVRSRGEAAAAAHRLGLADAAKTGAAGKK